MFIPSCVNCQFKKNFFSLMSPEELEIVNINRKEIKYKKGDLICKQGTTPTHIICMFNGLAKIYIEGNTSILLQILTSQNYIGIQNVFVPENTDGTYHYSVTALEDTHACLLDINQFRKVAYNSLPVTTEILHYLAKMESSFLKKIETLSQKNSHGRIADALIYLTEIFNTDKIDLKLTRKDIADFSSTSLENTIRILSELKSDNIINLDGKRLEILDKKKLIQIRNLG